MRVCCEQLSAYSLHYSGGGVLNISRGTLAFVLSFEAFLSRQGTRETAATESQAV